MIGVSDMQAGDTIKGKDIVLGMTVQRTLKGKSMADPIIVFEDGVYLNNPLYAEDEFLVLVSAAYYEEVSEEALQAMEKFLAERSEDAVFFPVDASNLSNTCLHLIREVRHLRNK